MPRRPPTARTSRGLSTRQWKDIRLACREADGRAVTLTVHGVVVAGDNRQHGPRLPAADNYVRGAASAGTADRMDTSGEAAPPSQRATKKAERDARRRAEHQQRHVLTRWATLAARSLRASRRTLRDGVWTASAWMRSNLSPKRDARRKIRAAFWNEWTRPRFSCKIGPPSLNPWSHRDRYIWEKALVLSNQLGKLGLINNRAGDPQTNPLSDDGASDDDEEMQAAIAASLLDSPAPGSPGAGPSGTTRSLEDAGISTPISSRARRKRPGRVQR